WKEREMSPTDGAPGPRPRNRVRALWAEGRPTLSLLITIPSVPLVQTLARAGFDSFVIDMEHGLIDVESAHALIAATAATPVVPYVPTPSTLPWRARAGPDAGAFGITFPMTRSRADAGAAVSAVRSPPRGERAWGPFYAPMRWDLPMPDYMRAADDEVIC